MKWLARCLWMCGCLAAMLGFFNPAAAGTMPLKLNPLAGVDSHGHLSVLRDPEGRLSADEAAADSAWKPLPGAVNAGYTSDILWLRLSVQRPADAPAQWLAQFSNALLDDVRLYRQDASWQWQLAMQS